MSAKKEKGPASPTQGGQILLIVVLVVIVASTVGLSLISRSITGIRTATEEAESQKALAAAEAGIERALQGNVSIGTTFLPDDNNSEYSAVVTQVSGAAPFLLNGGNIIPKNEGADVWFAVHNPDGTIDYSTTTSFIPPNNFFHLYWGSDSEGCGANDPAAIQAIVVTRASAADIKTYRYVYDSCSRDNNFVSAATGSFDIGGKTFTIRTPQGGTDELAKNLTNIVFMRVIPLYKDAVIGVSSCNHGGNRCTTLPSQGYVVSSTGISGAANRKLNVFKGYPQTYLPYISYGLFVAED